MSPSPLQELPVELFLDNLLPFVPVPDLLRLTCCNKLFASLCTDDMLWKRKISEDFNFFGQGTARTSGWNEKANGRLGLSHIPRSVAQGVPYPMQVRLPGVRIVSLMAGGMSFHALDSDGNVHVWGTLNGGWGPFAAENQGFSNVAKQAKTPLKLVLPNPIRSISCGRLHSSCLDDTNKVWTFTNWGRPFWLSSSILRDPDSAPRQIECGWAFSSLLTKYGEVFVWWPFAGSMGAAIEQKMRDMDNEGDKKARATEDGTIPCTTWDLDIIPIRLPSIPSLPELPNTDSPKTSKTTELVQIAAFDNHIVGLTNYGHVLKFGSLDDENSVPQGRWEYLPEFSEIGRVKEHPPFSTASETEKLEAPETMQITHITATFRHFVAYSTGSSSIVLVGDVDTKPDSLPKVIPQLQNKSIISLLTWGAYSNGALGLGDPLKLEPGTPGGFANFRDRQQAKERGRIGPTELPAVDVPTEVRFDHNCKKPIDRFCFAATASGWHTGALVIDLEPGVNDDEVEAGPTEDLTPSPSRWPGGATPPIIPLPGIIRLGHAGRGTFGRGRGGLHQPDNGGDTV
ncbi:hypothetical protein M413DRAFT_442608 [Hebeloma cylindrosporum]|uniref:F-box domain-containing protein n=1 Tax=Hebeloma cylindrosporum TaxID=76867 RepID=A0A0C3CKN1_HEBCY|nr:hypothetical protein M413DRAFT_442608 [Hebeloma cylindrosporum h7]